MSNFGGTTLVAVAGDRLYGSVICKVSESNPAYLTVEKEAVEARICRPKITDRIPPIFLAEDGHHDGLFTDISWKFFRNKL